MKRISQSMPRSFWSGVKVAIFFSGLLLVWMVLKPGSHDLYIAGNTLALPVSLTIGMIISFSGKPHWWDLSGISLKRAIHTSRFWQPAIFLLMCIGHFTAQVIVAYTTFTAPTTQPQVSWADFFFLTAYPLTVTFFLLLPTRPLPSLGRARVILNILILMVTAATMSWYFILGPSLLQSKTNLLFRIVTSAYPIGDLAFLFCLLQLASRAVDVRMRPGITLLLLATSLLIFQDVTIEYQTLNGTYAAGTFLDICMPVFYLCYGLAVHALRMGQVELPGKSGMSQREIIPSKHVAVVSFAWMSFLPYVLIPIMVGFTFYVLLQGRADPLAWGVYTGSFVLIALVLIRQITLIRDVAVYAKVTVQLNEELRKANNRLETQATTDPLTDLPNHRALLATLTSELEKAQRHQHSCALLFLDLDHFKALNDGYGHAAGDEVLIAFGQRLSESVRGIYTVGRWGGEEFIAILPETTMHEAQTIAERIRAMVNQQSFAIGGGLHLTCSIGVASYPSHATTLDALVNAADQAMYAAKRLGRNQHRLIDDPEVQLILTSGSNEGGREEAALSGLVAALVSLVEQDDMALGDHTKAVADLAERLAVQVGISAQEARMIHLAGLLHDIGKTCVPDAILQKSARLTPDEWQQVKRHPVVGAEIVAHIPALRPLAPVIRAHHERWDGAGYPDQLSEEDIPLAARVLAVANAYMAMIVKRPYQPARSSKEALKELQRCAGTQFDPAIVQALSTVITSQHELQSLQLIA